MKGGKREEIEMEGKEWCCRWIKCARFAQYPQEVHSLPDSVFVDSVSESYKTIPSLARLHPHLCPSSVWRKRWFKYSKCSMLGFCSIILLPSARESRDPKAPNVCNEILERERGGLWVEWEKTWKKVKQFMDFFEKNRNYSQIQTWQYWRKSQETITLYWSFLSPLPWILKRERSVLSI